MGVYETDDDNASFANESNYQYCMDSGFTNSERRFILAVDVVISTLIIITGIVGNSLSILVLKQDVRKSSMSVLLLALAVYDFSLILLSAPYLVVYHGLGTAVPGVREYVTTTKVVHLALPAMWFLGNVSRTGRNWIIVIVAIDRFMVVQNPFLSSQRSNPYRAKIYSFCITVAAIAFNIPTLFDYKVVPDICNSEILTIMALNPEEIGPLYALVYKKILHISIVVIGPMIMLMIFNVLLINSLLLAYRIRATITRETSRRYQETKMLVVIIAVFVICEIPGAVWHFMFNKMKPGQTWFYSYFFSTGNCLTLFNSAINFFIYCVWGRNFRQNMMYILKRRRPPHSRVIRFDSEHSDPTRQILILPPGSQPPGSTGGPRKSPENIEMNGGGACSSNSLRKTQPR